MSRCCRQILRRPNDRKDRCAKRRCTTALQECRRIGGPSDQKARAQEICSRGCAALAPEERVGYPALPGGQILNSAVHPSSAMPVPTLRRGRRGRPRAAITRRSPDAAAERGQTTGKSPEGWRRSCRRAKRRFAANHLSYVATAIPRRPTPPALAAQHPPAPPTKTERPKPTRDQSVDAQAASSWWKSQGRKGLTPSVRTLQSASAGGGETG